MHLQGRSREKSYRQLSKVSSELHFSSLFSLQWYIVLAECGLTTAHHSMHWSTITIAVSSKALSRMHALFKSTSYALTNEYASAGLTVAISIQSVPAAAPASNHNSLGFHPWSSPEKKLLNLGVAFRYDDPAATDGLEEAIKTFTAGLYRIAREEGVLDTHLYLNYAGGWQDVFAGYGNGSLQEMRQVARKYDERGMFQKQVKGGFKLDK